MKFSSIKVQTLVSKRLYIEWKVGNAGKALCGFHFSRYLN